MGLDKPNHRARSYAAQRLARVMEECTTNMDSLISEEPITPIYSPMSSVCGITPPEHQATNSSPSCLSSLRGGNKRTSSCIMGSRMALRQPTGWRGGTAYTKRGEQGQKRQRFEMDQPSGRLLKSPKRNTDNVSIPTQRLKPIQLSRTAQRTLKQIARIKAQLKTFVSYEVLDRLQDNSTMMNTISLEAKDRLLSLLESVDDAESAEELQQIAVNLIDKVMTQCQSQLQAEHDSIETFARKELKVETSHARLECDLRKRIQAERDEVAKLLPLTQTLRASRKSVVQECRALESRVQSLNTEALSIDNTLASIRDTRQRITFASFRDVTNRINTSREAILSVEQEISQYDESIVQSLRDIVVHCGPVSKKHHQREERNTSGKSPAVLTPSLSSPIVARTVIPSHPVPPVTTGPLLPVIAIRGRHSPPSSVVTLSLKGPPKSGASVTKEPKEQTGVYTGGDMSVSRATQLIERDGVTNCTKLRQWDAPIRLMSMSFDAAVESVGTILALYEKNELQEEPLELITKPNSVSLLNAISQLTSTSLPVHPKTAHYHGSNYHFQCDLLRELHSSMISIPRKLTVNRSAQSQEHQNEKHFDRKTVVPCFAIIGTSCGLGPRSFYGPKTSRINATCDLWDRGDDDDEQSHEAITRGVIHELIDPIGSDAAAHAASHAEFVTVYQRSKASDVPAPSPMNITEELAPSNSVTTPSVSDTSTATLTELVHSFGLEAEGLKGFPGRSIKMKRSSISDGANIPSPILQKKQEPSSDPVPVPCLKTTHNDEYMTKYSMPRAAAMESLGEFFQLLCRESWLFRQTCDINSENVSSFTISDSSEDLNSATISCVVSIDDHDHKPIACVALVILSDAELSNVPTSKQWAEKLCSMAQWKDVNLVWRPVFHALDESMWTDDVENES